MSEGEQPERVEAELLFQEEISLHWHVRKQQGTYVLYFGAKVEPDDTYHGVHLDFSSTPVDRWDEAGIQHMAERMATKLGTDIREFIKPRFADALEGIRALRTQDIDREVAAFEIPDTLPPLAGGEAAGE